MGPAGNGGAFYEVKKIRLRLQTLAAVMGGFEISQKVSGVLNVSRAQ